MVEILIKLFLFYTRRLSREKALKKGERLGAFVWKTGLRKKVVLRNLKIAFPGRSEEWYNEIGKKCYVHLGRIVMEFGKLPDYLCTKQIKDLVIFDKGKELLEQYKNSGAILVSGHIGNWEIMGTGLASKGYKLSALAYKQKNEKVNDILHKIRTGCCINMVYHRDSVKPLVYALKRGEFAVFLIDQNTVKERGVFVDFFGQKTLTVDFPAKLAVKLNKPVLFCYTRFDEESGIYKLRVEEVEWKEGKDTEETVKNIVQAYTEKIEKTVAECPSQYLWGHKRWKTRPEGEKSLY